MFTPSFTSRRHHSRLPIEKFSRDNFIPKWFASKRASTVRSIAANLPDMEMLPAENARGFLLAQESETVSKNASKSVENMACRVVAVYR